LTVSTAYLLFIGLRAGLRALDPILVLPEFPLNLFVGLIITVLITVLISMLSVGAGVLLNQGMCHWLLDQDGNAWHGAGTALGHWTAITLLQLALLFWSGVRFGATPPIGVALTALGGGVSGAWLSQHGLRIPVPFQVGWRRAMILTWGVGWAGVMFLLYRLIEYAPPPRFVP
jgi:hypothetical protein